ncbi:MAG: nucleotidyltransferase family protein [Fimbriimonadales bacterium]
MKRDEAVAKLKEIEPELRNLGVRSLSIFGSVANERAKDLSDLDLIVEFEPPRGFDKYFDVLFFIEERLGVHVDLAQPDTLHPLLRDRILREAVKVA